MTRDGVTGWACMTLAARLAAEPRASRAYGSQVRFRPARLSASRVIDAATIRPSTEIGMIDEPSESSPYSRATALMCRYETTAAIPATARTDRTVAILIHISPSLRRPVGESAFGTVVGSLH